MEIMVRRQKIKERKKMLDDLKDMIKRHEGFSPEPYFCSEGVLTVGYGRNLEAVGVSETEADYMLDSDIDSSLEDLRSIFPKWDSFPDAKKIALADMRFQLGYYRFRSFKKMIDAVNDGNWGKAANEAFESKWRRQTPNRALEIIEMLKN